MVRKKLKQQKGETLVETLAALLIATLSVMVLTSAITVSARINAQNKSADEQFADDLKIAESYSGSGVGKEVQFSVTGHNLNAANSMIPMNTEFSNKKVAVKVYGKENGKLASYQIGETEQTEEEMP